MLLSPTTSPGLILLFSFFIGWQDWQKKENRPYIQDRKQEIRYEPLNMMDIFLMKITVSWN